MNEQLRQQMDLVRDAFKHVPQHKQRSFLVAIFNVLIRPMGLDSILRELDFLNDDG